MNSKIPDTLGPGETSRVPADRLIAGDPRLTAWVHFANAARDFCAGIWHSERGQRKIADEEEEFCHMLEGERIVTDEEAANAQP